MPCCRPGSSRADGRADGRDGPAALPRPAVRVVGSDARSRAAARAARLRGRRLRRGRGGAAGGVRRRPARRGARCARRLRRGAGAGRPGGDARRAARRLRRRAAVAAGAGGRRSRFVGPGRPPHRLPGLEADRRGRGAGGRGQRRHRLAGPRRRRRARRAARRRPGSAASSSRSAWATTRGGWPPCARRRATRWRCGSTPTAPGRRPTRRSPTCARSPRSASSCARSRCTGSRSCAPCGRARRCRWRWTRRPPSASAPGSGAADAVCLKISRCGGISGLLRDARAARAAGAKVYVASTFDGPLGVAAGLHAAAGLRASGPVGFCGLASLGWFEGFADVLAPVDGSIAVPGGRGCSGERQLRLGREAGEPAAARGNCARWAGGRELSLISRGFRGNSTRFARSPTTPAPSLSLPSRS